MGLSFEQGEWITSEESDRRRRVKLEEEQREFERLLLGPDAASAAPGKALVTATAPTSSYKFVASMKGRIFGERSDQDLLDFAKICASEMTARRKSLADWEIWRRRFNTLSLELNERGMFPPAFRPRMPAPAHTDRSDSDNVHSTDLQVIDLHWLKCRGWRSVNSRAAVAPVFTNVTFSFHRAAEFAGLNWQMKNKIAAIRLPHRSQWEMAVLRHPEIPTLLRRWRREAERFEAEILWAADRRQELRRCVDQWPQLWIARQIAGHRDGLSVVDESAVSATDIATVLKMMTGTSKARQTVATQVARMLKFRRTRR